MSNMSSKYSETYPCAQCNESIITEPMCTTCDVWFCRRCTKDIKRNPLEFVDWRPCLQVDGMPCQPRV